MHKFDIKNKVAIITGGASGLGFQYALKLLEKEVKGVTLADIDDDTGRKALEEITRKFGKNKAIFVKTDVTSHKQFEETFKKTVDAFSNVDILINNAGILNDVIWEKEIDINLKGTVIGTILAFDHYIPKYKTSTEGLIVNVASIGGVTGYAGTPIYNATKFAVHGLTLSYGKKFHYDRAKVRVVCICPGVTITPLITNLPGRFLGPEYEEISIQEVPKMPPQMPDQLASNVIKVIQHASNGTIWIIEGGEEPYQYEMPDRFSIEKKVHLVTDTE